MESTSLPVLPSSAPGAPALRPRPRFAWLVPFPFLLLLFVAWQAPFPLRSRPRESRERSVTVALAQQFNLSASPSDVHWLSDPSKGGRIRAWVLAAAPAELDDVFLVTARLSPEGRMIALESVHNITDTSAVGESSLVADGALAAYRLAEREVPTSTDPQPGSKRELTYSVHLLDAKRGAPQRAGAGARERWMQHLTQVQTTGLWRGVRKRSFKLDPPARNWWMTLQSGELRALFEGHELRVPERGAPTEGARFVLERKVAAARIGNLTTWSVDRLRGVRWFGDENMQRLKAVVYRARDQLMRWLGRNDAPTENEELLADLGTRRSANDSPSRHLSRETTWPPPDLAPMLDPPFEGEGQWLSLEGDPFVRGTAAGATPVYTTFVRPDPERKFAKVSIALWDPRDVELHMEGGTQEPKSATGEQGSGLIPRDPEVMKRLVGAFNGGFQGTHGSYGMYVQQKLLVPPRPYAATVFRLKDGSTGFGTWPNSPAVPDDVDSFRQNLSPLIANGKLNPYGRLWWGGVPHGWEDDTRTVRSGLCLTRRGHIAYFYGAQVDHVHLGRAMLRADCVYALHLDMNQGHTGLEFYRVDEADALPPLAMPLSGMWQAEGIVPEAPGLRFRGRRMFRSMQLMNFPRYIQRGERDFFYLTLRKTLPPPRLALADNQPHEGVYSTPVKADDVLPVPLSLTSVRPEVIQRPETRVHLLVLDTTRLTPDCAQGERAWIAVDPAAAAAAAAAAGLFLEGGVWKISDSPRERVVARGSRESGLGAPAAWGLSSDSETLYYAEIASAPDPATDGQLLAQSLRHAGAAQWLFVAERAPLAIAEQREPSGHPRVPSPGALRLCRREPRFFRGVFADTPVLQRGAWKAIQEAGFPVLSAAQD